MRERRSPAKTAPASASRSRAVSVKPASQPWSSGCRVKKSSASMSDPCSSPADVRIRSTTSVCLKFVDPRVTRLEDKAQKAFVSRFKALLEGEAAVFDMEPHRNAPPGLRLWCGCTVETADVVAATPWLEWAFETAVAEVG